MRGRLGASAQPHFIRKSKTMKAILLVQILSLQCRLKKSALFHRLMTFVTNEKGYPPRFEFNPLNSKLYEIFIPVISMLSV